MNICVEVNDSAAMSMAEYGVAMRLVSSFVEFEHLVQPLYHKLSWFFMTLGLIGQILCLIILKNGVSTQTPHFIFYKLMTIAELIYCCNYFFSQALAALSTPGNSVRFQWYLHYWTAFYCCAIARLIYSSTGYIVLYMAVIITLDRFAAVWWQNWYRRINYVLKQELNVKRLCIIAVLFSTCIHSWSALAEFTVVFRTNPKSKVRLYYCVSRKKPDVLVTMKHIKNMYNMALRLAYPPVLLVLTIGVIWGFMRYQKHRESLLGRNVSFYTQRRAKERRRETNLFYLMFAVVTLAFIQVVPVEVKRYLVFVHGSLRTLRSIVESVTRCLVSLDTAKVAIKYLYIVQSAQLAANLATQADRSLKFYLYLILNQQFRTEAKRVLRMPFGANGRKRRSLRQRIKTEIQNSTVGAVHLATVPRSHTDGQSRSGLDLIAVVDPSHSESRGHMSIV